MGCVLYTIQDSLYAAAAPWRAFAQSAAYFSSHPLSPISNSPLARSIAASCELFERSSRQWEKPVFGLDSTVVDGVEVRVTEEVAHERPFCRLVHFRRDRSQLHSQAHPRVLVVAPRSGHFASLVRGTVEALLPEHDVYVTDWANARDVPLDEGRFDLDDYIDYTIEFLRLLGPDLHVIAVCQPTVPVLAAISIMSSEGDSAVPRSMTLMAGPIDPRESPTQVNEVATGNSYQWFEQMMIDTVPCRYSGAGRRVHPGFQQLGAFMAMNPDRHYQAYSRFAEDLIRGDEAGAQAHRTFYDEYLSVMDLAGEFFLQTVKSIFQDFDLPLGKMSSRGRRIDPSAIRTTALMTIEGERDDISGLGQTKAAHGLCANLRPEQRVHYEQAGVGHFGVFSGHHWRDEVLPRVHAFIRAQA